MIDVIAILQRGMSTSGIIATSFLTLILRLYVVGGVHASLLHLSSAISSDPGSSNCLPAFCLSIGFARFQHFVTMFQITSAFSFAPLFGMCLLILTFPFGSIFGMCPLVFMVIVSATLPTPTMKPARVFFLSPKIFERRWVFFPTFRAPLEGIGDIQHDDVPFVCSKKNVGKRWNYRRSGINLADILKYIPDEDFSQTVVEWIQPERTTERQRIAKAGMLYVREHFSAQAQARKLFCELLPLLQRVYELA
jgi:hypothetical protein